MTAFSIIKMATQLVALPEIERLSPLVIRILAGNPGKFTLQGTNTYLIGTGSHRLLIDTGAGLPSWSAALAKVLAQEKATVSTALITHWHHDHVGGIRDLERACPGVRVYKHSPDGEGGVLDLQEGEVFREEGATVEAVYSPGHTADHTSFWLREERALFTGDCVLGQGTTVFETLTPYLASLTTLRAKRAIRAYPGHGPLLTDPDATIAEYLAHRAERERQILTLLQARNARRDEAGWTAEELARRVYPAELPREVLRAAVHGVEQVLGKLEGEGRVVRERAEGGWVVRRDRHAL